MCFQSRRTSTSKKQSWPSRILVLLALITSLAGGNAAVAQECPDPAPQTSGSHSFKRIGETFDIPIAMGDCQAIALTVRWANGRNNGSIFNLTFFDGEDRPLYTKQISAFITGTFEFPLIPYEYQPYGTMSVSSVPASVTVQSAPPFGVPAVLSYTVSRVGRRTRGAAAKFKVVDAALAESLKSAPGKVIAETPSYVLTEIALAEPRQIEAEGKKQTIRSAFRLLIPNSGPIVTNSVDLVWLDDYAVPVFRTGKRGEEVGALIYDDTVLRNGAEISISNLITGRSHSFSEQLNFPSRSATTTQKSKSDDCVVTGVKSAVRLIGARRQALVQIQLKTNRPFPAVESALKLQVGRRFFVDELAGDHTGRTLTLTLTPEMFAELKDGALIGAFFNKPDWSGYAGDDIWAFGRLNKSLLDK